MFGMVSNAEPISEYLAPRREIAEAISVRVFPPIFHSVEATELYAAQRPGDLGGPGPRDAVDASSDVAPAPDPVGPSRRLTIQYSTGIRGPLA